MPAFQVGKPVLAHVEMARDGARWGELAVFPYFTNNLSMKARHPRAKISFKASVECCAFPATVLYVHFALALLSRPLQVSPAA